MGIENRDYYSGERRVQFVSPLGPQWKTSAVTWLIGINVGIWLLQVITMSRVPGESGLITELLRCSSEAVFGKLQIWRLLTGAFAHSEDGLGHIFWNMLYLFFFGAPIEKIYGRKDFVAFYLTVGILANLVFVLFYSGPVLGASGCGVALVVLCALYYPHRTVIFLFFPIPLWLLGVFIVGSDIFGIMSPQASNTAFAVHVAGAALGALYKFVDLRWSTLTSGFTRWKFRKRAERAFRGRSSGKRGASDGIPRFTEDIENQRLDRILAKIHEFGKESLTDDEEQFLALMSKRYKKGHS